MATKAELMAEVKRLRAIHNEEPKFLGMEWDPKEGLEVKVEHWAARHLAVSLWDTFKKCGGENYVTMTLQGGSEGPIEVTIRPHWTSKKTPAMRIAELEEEVASLRTLQNEKG